MYVKDTKISEICAGKIDFQLRVRVINLWSTPDRNNPTEEGAIHMILLDETRGRIHATIRKDLISKFKELVQDGCAYHLERFMVAKNDPTFRTTSHKHKLNFMRRTSVFKVTANEIPKNHFEFMSFQEILSCTTEDRYLGHVVEKTPMKETDKNGKTSKVMDATLEDLEGTRIHCTLWSDFAVKMQQYLDNNDPAQPLVIVFQHCKLKKYLGAMGISNSFYGSKLFLNDDLPEIAEYVERMNDANVQLTQVVSQMTGPPIISVADDLLQTQRMTIEDLIESTEKCFGAVLAWTCEFDTDLGWFYQACSKCSSRISFVGGQLYCEKCKMPRTALPKYKVHLQVIDDTGSITFVLFDRIVFQIVGMTAQDLLDGMNNNNNSRSYPPALEAFINKRMLFKVEVTDANLYRNWRGYTVKKLTDDEEIINRFTSLHGINLSIEDGNPNNDNLLSQINCDTSQDIVEGGDSTNNEGIALPELLSTPTSKLAGKRPISPGGIGGSGTKEIVVGQDMDCKTSLNFDGLGDSTTVDASAVDGSVDCTSSIMIQTNKSTTKRSAEMDGGSIVGSKETKMSRGKNKKK
ncbi:replication protein A 70 kDa DNA-binding subunit [Trifolium repens]|nr:replication protein A 70 kDa DNA-binding subunit [Trifolium repens]